MNERNRLINSILFPLIFVLLLWTVKIFEYFSGFDLSVLGVFPQKLSGLTGIVFSPFIHGDFSHLISNTIPLLVLSTGIFYFFPEIAFKVILFVWIVTNFCVWTSARESYHIGASGLVYGFAAFLFFIGVFLRKTNHAAISLLVVFLYGGMIWGILPTKDHISWESHLIGSLTGLFMAIYYSYKIKKQNDLQKIQYVDFLSVHATNKNLKINYEYKESEDSE